MPAIETSGAYNLRSSHRSFRISFSQNWDKTRMETQCTVQWLNADQLPAACPGDVAQVWNQHPRVFLIFNEAGRSVCPYCGATYQLKEKIAHD